MTETTGPAIGAGGTPRRTAVRRDYVQWLVYGCLALAVAWISLLLLRANQDRAAMRAGQSRLLSQHGVSQPGHKRLSPSYVDADGDLLADPPAAKDAIAPESLTVAYYVGDEDENVMVDWKGFAEHLQQLTGKPATCQEYLNSSEEVAAVKAGSIQLVALHAADTPYLVNHAGFVPVAVLGNDSGPNGNHLNLAVHAECAARKLSDLRGMELICTRPDSITGYRAAIAVLLSETGMRPDVDYSIRYSHGQRRSIEGLAAGEFQVAALSDDKLQSLLKEGSVQADDYRVLYESKVIPRLTIGYVHSLHPELASAVSKAILEFANQAATPEESTGKPLRFLPIDYKSDFEFVRRIDDAFDPRFGKRPVADLIP